MDPNPDLDPAVWRPDGPVRVTAVLTDIPGLTVLNVDGVVARPGDTLAVHVTVGPDGGPTARLVHRRPRWWTFGRPIDVNAARAATAGVTASWRWIATRLRRPKDGDVMTVWDVPALARVAVVDAWIAWHRPEMLALRPDDRMVVRIFGPQARLIDRTDWHPRRLLERIGCLRALRRIDAAELDVDATREQQVTELTRYGFPRAAIRLTGDAVAAERAAAFMVDLGEPNDDPTRGVAW